MDRVLSLQKLERPEADGPQQGSWLSIGCDSSASIDCEDSLQQE